MDQPAWLQAAWAEFGQAEIGGRAHNARILAMFRDSGHPQIGNDETAWCAAFAGACLERSGIASTRSLRARSYAAWGTPISEARTGAIAVLSRGSNAALGHVGFVVGETRRGIVLLGGNQNDSVSVALFERARLLALRWPLEPEAARMRPVEEPASGPDFEVALAHVLKMEGGFSDDPHDPGGPTNQGITLKVFAAHTGRTLDAISRAGLISDLRAIPPETVRTIYYRRYWEPASCAELPPGVALMHFDAAVNHGVGTALRTLQEAAQVPADGEMGPVTRAAAASADAAELIERYAAIRASRYRALSHFWRFGRGWLRRVAATREASLASLANAASRHGERPSAEPPGTSRTEPSSTEHTASASRTLPSSTVNQGDTAMSDTATQPAKWWGQSMTIWGAIVTALATVVPVLGPLIGIELSADAVRQVSSELISALQAIGGVIGTLMTIYGRLRATQPLMRRDMNVRL